MSLSKLAGDATLLTIEGPLSEEYVRRVLKSLWDCEREMGNAQVRIALDDESATPDYAIDALMDAETDEGTRWKSFSGRTHRPLTDAISARSTWSSDAIPLAKIAKLMGSIRGYKRP